MTMIAAALSIAFGFIALYGAIHFLMKNNRVRQWPKVEGRVVERHLQAFHTGIRSPTPNYALVVKCDYSINGITYDGGGFAPTRIAYWPKRKAQRKLDEIPDRLTLYVNPADPTEAYIRLIPARYWMAFFGVSLFCFVLGSIYALQP